MIHDFNQRLSFNAVAIDQNVSQSSGDMTAYGGFHPRAKTNQTTKRQRMAPRKGSDTNSALNLVVMNTKASSNGTTQHFYRGATSQKLTRRIGEDRTSHSVEQIKVGEQLIANVGDLNRTIIDIN